MAEYTYNATINEGIGENFSSSGSATPNIVYSYTTATEDNFVDIDYMLITQVHSVSVDLGLIMEHADIAFDYKFITPDFNDQNKVKTSGSSTVVSSNAYNGSGTIKVGEYVPPVFVWVGSGTLFEMGGDITRMVAPGITGPPIVSSTTKIYSGEGFIAYNIFSTDSRNYTYNEGLSGDDTTFSTRNYGLLDAHSTAYDYGSIDQFSNLSYEDYRYIDYIPVYGKLLVGGTSEPTLRTYSEISTGTLFAVDSASESVLIVDQTDTNTSLFTIFGSASIDKNLLPTIRSYTGSGDIFSVGNNIERASYDYNESSTVEFSSSDYGLITASGTTVNYGLIIDEVSEQYNYGSIVNIDVVRPYGIISVVGSASYDESYAYVGDGIIHTVSGVADSASFNPPEETVLFNITGGYSSAFLVRGYIASGSIQTLNASSSNSTYTYNITSISSYSTEDLGNITASGTTANYGLVVDGSDAENNYGYVINTDFVYPFGSLNASGIVSTKRRNSFFASGSVNVSGDAGVVFTEPTPQVYVDRDAVLFNVSGSAATVFQRGAIYSGTGSLFTISGSTSSRTWSYTFGSIVEFNTEDYQSITVSGVTVDYGSVALTGSDLDYGFVFNRQTEYPYRGLTTVYGDATVFFYRRPSYVAQGSVFAIGGEAGVVAFAGKKKESTDLFRISGDATTLRSPKYDASGTYNTFFGSTNTASYSYNFSATQSYTEGDYGSITASGTTINYGVVTEGSSVEFNYGYIIDSKIIKSPFGSLFVSGTFSNLKLTDAYAGSGTINVSGDVGVVFTEPTPQVYVDRDAVLFFVTGNANVEFYRRPSFVGSGKLTSFNGSASSRAYNYSTASINTLSQTDFGSITASGVTNNYGFVYNSSDAELFYGYVVDRDTLYPFGGLSVNSITTVSKTKIKITSGQISILRGSADAAVFVDKSIESTELFTISGASENNVRYSAVGTGSVISIVKSDNSATYHYNTSSINEFETNDFGSITASGITVNYGSVAVGSDVEFDYGYVFDTVSIYPFGPLNIRGNAITDLDTAPSYVGSGTLFALNGSADTLVPSIKTDTETSLFTVFGKAGESERRSYIASGSIFSKGIGGESASYSYNESSTYSDGFAQTYTTADFGSITTSGITADYGYVYNSSSNEDDYGTIVIGSVVAPYGNLTISGGISNFRRSFGFSGSGLINSIGTATVVFTEPTPQIYVDREIALFSVYGNAATAIVRAPVYAGSGSLFNIGNSESSVTYNYSFTSIESFGTLDLGSITASGITTNYGSVTQDSSADIDYGYVIIRETEFPYRGKVDVYGSATVQFNRIPSYSGSGTLFETGGSALIFSLFGRKDLDSTDLFAVYGDAETHFVPSYKASGSYRTTNIPPDSASYSYNSTSILGYGTDNYGTITTSGFTSNYGSIAEGSSAEFDYGEIKDTTIVYPYGSLNVSGNGDTIRQLGVSIPATGSLFAVGGEADSRAIIVQTDTETTNLFTVYGEATVQVASAYDQFSAISFGTLFGSGYIEERATYHYNTSSKNLYSQFDYQSVSSSPTTSSDYGFITSESGSELNYGYINENQSNYAFGSININGSVSSSFLPTLNFKGSGKIDVYGSCGLVVILTAKKEPESTDLYNVYGSADVAVVRPAQVERAGINLLSGAAESVTYIYNETIVNVFSNIDLGSITASGITQDYGLVSNPSVGGIDYGSVIFGVTTYPYGLFTYSGNAQTEFNLGPIYSGSGSLFVSGSATTIRTQAAETTDLFKISGEAGVPFSRFYSASGTLFHIGDKIESASFAYNTSSVSEFVSTDYQFVSSVASVSDNYGTITTDPEQAFDYGLITDTITRYPFGTLNISGSAGVIAYQVYSQVGSGSLFVSGSATTIRTQAAETTDLFKISGEASVPFSRPYIASGSLFSIGDKIESVTYTYNQSSEIPFESVDYQFITASGLTQDYGFISNFINSADDYGSIAVIESIKPYGSISFSGSAEITIPAIYTGRGSLFTTGGSAESKVISIPTDTQLFRISGAATDIQRSFGYFADGILFNIGDKIESVTYSYNQSSIIPFESLDYQFITTSGFTENYGFIIDGVNDINDYGSITISESKIPYGSIFFGGSAFVAIPAIYAGSGSIFTVGGEADSRAIFVPTDTQLFRISGAATDIQRSFGYFTTGSLFSIGSLEERIAYSYNESSSTEYSSFDYEFVNNVPTSINDYGFINQGSGNVDDYGSISITSQQIPFGTLTLTGASSETFKPILAWKGTGEINIFGEVLVGFSLSGKKQLESTDLFNVYGSADVSRPFTAVGGGSLFSIGDKIERASYSYNTSSILGFDKRDYQFITASGIQLDYGNIFDPLTAGIDDYGYIVYQNDLVYPFGTLNISGGFSNLQIANAPKGSGSLFAIGGESNAYSRIAVTDTQLFVASGDAATPRSRTFIGSGSLFAYTGLAEAITANPPENTQLFAISGGAIEKNTESYVGSGIALQLQTGIYPEYLYYRPVPRYVNSIYGPIGGDITISGAISQKATNAFVGTGSISVVGTATEKNTESYNGTGIEFISGGSRERFMPVHIGTGSIFSIGGIAESSTKVVPSETQLFRITGSAIEVHTESYVGSGTEFISGQSLEAKTNIFSASGSLFTFNSATESVSVVSAGTGLYNIAGQTAEAFARATYEGSGNLFTFNSLTESRTYTAPSETCLFRATGTATETSTVANVGSGTEFVYGDSVNSFIPRYFGSGSLFTSGGKADVFAIVASTNTILFNISGVAGESTSNVFVGSGSLFITSGTAESTSVAITSTGLYTASGTATENITSAYIGSGSLFTTNGLAESFSNAIQTETQLFRISGTATEIQSDSYVGSGTEFISGAGRERYMPVYITSGSLSIANGAAESTVRIVPTEIQLFRISGAATEIQSDSYIGSGTEFISGASTQIRINSYAGSGSLFTANGLAESSAKIVPSETQLFRISGGADQKATNIYNGSGSLFATNGLAESFSNVIATETQLFRVTGSATETHSENYVGTGTEFISGTITISSVAIYSGAGSIRTLSGASESKTVSDPTETQLFRVSGNATTAYNATFTHVASGTEFISGSATEKQRDSYVGKGSLFAFNSASLVSTISIPVETQLFRISGNGGSSFTRISVFEGGQINTSGQSADQRIIFTPARIFGTII